MTMLRKALGLVLGMAIGCGAAWAQNDAPQSDPPSLGDVARQKPQQKATKSFDDDNFQRTAPPPAPEEAPKPKADDKAKEAAPPDQVKALEQQLAETTKKRDAAQKSIAGIQGRIDSGNLNDDTRSSMAGAQDAYKDRLKELDGQIEELQKKLDAARAAAPKSDAAAKPDDAKPASDAKTDAKQ